MAKIYDVLILTQNNKGLRLAKDLRQAGKEVAWVDVTSKTSWASRDLEGPFCVGLPQESTDAEKREFQEDQRLRPVPQGFCLWHDKGMVEFGSPIVETQLKKLKEQKGLEYIQNEMPNTVLRDFIKPMKNKALEETWLMYFAFYFNKSSLDMNLASLQKQVSSFPLFSPSYLIEKNFSLRKQDLESLSTVGVDVLSLDEIRFRQEGESFYYYDGDKGLVTSKVIVSFLSSWDLRTVDPTFYQQVFPNPPNSPSWVWKPYSVTGEVKVDTQNTPPWVAFLLNWDLPWFEDNFFILRRSSEGAWNLWTRVPFEKSQCREYHQFLLTKLSQRLNERFCSNNIQVQWDGNPSKDNDLLDLELFPVYSPKSLKMKTSNPNFHHMGPDKFSSFDAFDIYKKEKQLAARMIQGGLH